MVQRSIPSEPHAGCERISNEPEDMNGFTPVIGLGTSLHGRGTEGDYDIELARGDLLRDGVHRADIPFGVVLPEDQILPVYKTIVLESLKGTLEALQEHRLGSIDQNSQTGNSLCPNFALMPIRNEQYARQQRNQKRAQE